MLKEIGHYYALPLAGLRIRQIVYDGLLRLVFRDDDERVMLDLHGDFVIRKSGHETSFSPRQPEALVLFHGWFQAGVTVSTAKADKHGRLFVTLSNRQELLVEDGPNENWHLYVENRQQPQRNLAVHGGVGTTYS